MSDTIRNATGHWESLLVSFGISPEALTGKHGPCPLCGGNDRFRFDNKKHRGTYICSQCGAGDGMQLLTEYTGRSFRDLADEIDRKLGTCAADRPKAPEVNPSIRIKKICSQLQTIDSINPVRLYLQNRGLKYAPPSLRYHPAMPYYDNTGTMRAKFPAMVASLRTPDDLGSTLHITYLTPTGDKARVKVQKKLLSPMRATAGSAIRLTQPAKTLGIAEGIETAIAVMGQYKVPCWATANSGLMEKLILPDTVENVQIYGDNDSSFTGHKAAYTLANRLVREGRSVELLFPELVGADFADKREMQA